MHARQVLVQIAEMVLAELGRFVALHLQDGGESDGLCWKSYVGAGLSDGGETSADRQLAGDEVGATRRATRLGVIVGKYHPLGGELIEIGSLARHDPTIVSADVEPADVVAHDDDDV